MSVDKNLQGELLRAWDGTSGYVLHGGKQYRVIIGDDPVFIEEDTARLADSTSTGMVKAPAPARIDASEIAPQDPPPQVQPKRKAPKISDVD